MVNVLIGPGRISPGESTKICGRCHSVIRSHPHWPRCAYAWSWITPSGSAPWAAMQ